LTCWSCTAALQALGSVPLKLLLLPSNTCMSQRHSTCSWKSGDRVAHWLARWYHSAMLVRQSPSHHSFDIYQDKPAAEGFLHLNISMRHVWRTLVWGSEFRGGRGPLRPKPETFRATTSNPSALHVTPAQGRVALQALVPCQLDRRPCGSETVPFQTFSQC
jgi:hypothetical protein